jgi:hypothetical protein
VRVFFNMLKARQHSSLKCQGVPLWVRQVSGIVGIVVNEASVEIGKLEEGLDIADFLRFGPVLDGLHFSIRHSETIG